MRALRIWVLQIGEPLPTRAVREMRTALLCRKLTARGHTVLWWASAFDHLNKEWLFPDDARSMIEPSLEILALRGCGYAKNISLRRFVDHRLIARKFRSLAETERRPDLIVASMPTHDLAYEAAVYASKHRVPLVVDVRDPWPDRLVEYAPSPVRGVVKLLLSRDYWMVRYLFASASSLTSMMDSLLRWAQALGGERSTQADRTFYLGAARLEVPRTAPSSKLDFLSGLSDRSVISFVGTFGHHNHPGILAEAAGRMRHERVHFVLGGSGDFFDEVKSISAGLDNVTLTGWLTEPEIAYLMSRSILGIVPCNYETDAFPNKTFTYLAAGVPIISSLQGDVRVLLARENIGRYYPPNDVGCLVEVIRSLMEHPDVLDEMARNAERFFRKELDAAVIYEEFARHVELVARGEDVKGVR